MRFDLILFPLLGGYLFLTSCPATKYIHQRLDRQRLIFHSAVVGGLLILVAFFVREYAVPDSMIGFIKGILPKLISNSGWNTVFATLPLGLILGLLSWAALSLQWPFPGTTYFFMARPLGHPVFFRRPIRVRWLFSKERWIRYAVSEIGNDFDQLYLNAIKNKWTVEVTMSGGKVYVGKVLAISKPRETNQLRILPVMSGYRDKDDKTLTFNTFYSKIYRHYRERGVSEQELNMDLIIDRKEIISANRFDFEVYVQFGIQKAHPTSKSQ